MKYKNIKREMTILGPKILATDHGTIASFPYMLLISTSIKFHHFNYSMFVETIEYY